VFTKLIERNTTIPTRKSEIFSTAADSQPSVEIHVQQGEREMASGNKSIGRFRLDGIPPAPRGMPQIEVTFDIDANGILHVSAKDLGTGKEQKITITASSGLNEKEIQRMVQDSKDHAEGDHKRREEAETRNRADAAAYESEKLIKEHAAKLPAERKAEVERAVERVKSALKGQDYGEMKAAAEDLNTLWQSVSGELYQQARAAGTPPPDGAPGGAGDAGPRPEGKPAEGDVIDADFEMVDEDKKGKR